MRYILFVFILMGGVISFNSNASSVVDSPSSASKQCRVNSVLFNTVLYDTFQDSFSYVYAYYDGCEYKDLGTVHYSVASGGWYSSSWYGTGNADPSKVISSSVAPVNDGGTSFIDSGDFSVSGDKPLEINNSCSSSSPSLTGAYTFIVIDGTVHANINNCDYILPKGSPVPVYMPLPDGGVSVQDEGPWYPTGATGIGVSQKPQPVVVSPVHNPVHEKYEEQLNRYCSQSGKCSPDEDGEGMYPIDDSDFLDFVKKDDAAHNKPAENPADKPLDSGVPAVNIPVSYAEQLRRYCSIPGKCEEKYGYLYPVNDSDFIEFQKVNYPQNLPSKSPYSDFTVPEKPNISELYSLYNSCTKELSGFTSPAENNSYNPSSIYAYNSQVDKCNAIIDKFQGSFPPGGKYSVSKDGREFVTSNFNGTSVRCYASPGSDSMTGTPVSHLSYQTPPRPGVTLSGDLHFPQYLNMNYVGRETWPDELCNSVANRPADVSPDYVSSLSSGSSGGSGGSVNSGSSPGVSSGGSGSSTHNLSSPGDGHVASGSNGNNKGDGNNNGDVVAAINALHADTNKNHEDTMKALDVSGGSLDGVKGGLSSGVSSLIDGLKKEMGDSFNDALAEFKDVFGDIDSYIPDIKLSFDLPVQFTAGIRGRCVPLVFDFDIALAGFSPYHFHAEGIQACKLYDLYIRSIIEWFLYFMTAFACRRVFTRAAEFITSR